MKKNFKRILLSFLLFCFYHNSIATHIVGGELYYHWLGNNNYAIEMRVYRDCYNGVPFFDAVASIGVFNANNALLYELCVPLLSYDTIPPTIVSPCFIPPTDVCYQRGIYRDTINLPPVAGGYQLAYQRCCRNVTILNIQTPLDVGITIYATIPTNVANAINSNPVYNALPPPFICLGIPFQFDHSATDADGDSLVYELCLPYVGGENNNNSCPITNQPACGAGTWTCGPAPHPPFNPPYGNVLWQPPFSLSNLLGGVPMAINSQTGLLTCTPNTVGQFVYGVCVREYRNNSLIGKTRRDFQVNVVPCPSLVVAALQSPLIHCGDSTVFFQNNSIGASSYFWNFGDPNTLADTSHSFSPTYSYPDTGSYTVTLIAYSSFNPGCADTTTGVVHIYPPFNAGFTFADSLCTYIVSFNDSSSNNGSGTSSVWHWGFGDNTTSTIQNPVHTYPGPGNYLVKLITISNFGCIDTVEQMITLDTLPSVTISLTQSVKCHGDCNAVATANPKGGTMPYTFLWNDPNNQATQIANNLCAGTYTVIINDSNHCISSATITIADPPALNTSLLSTDAYCNGKCIGTATANPVGGTPVYTYIWSDPDSQKTKTATDLCPGIYSVTITDSHGCTKTDSVTVNFSNYIPPLDATVNNDTIYEGQTVQLWSTIYSNTIYSWTPPDFLSNAAISNPSATLNSTAVYIYVIEISDSLGCKNSDSVRIVVKNVICVEPEIFIPNAFTPNADGNNDILYVRGNTIKELLLRIYDRWGEKVFETNTPGSGWDGTYNGQPVQTGVYDYYLETTCFNDEKFFKKGNVTVIK